MAFTLGDHPKIGQFSLPYATVRTRVRPCLPQPHGTLNVLFTCVSLQPRGARPAPHVQRATPSPRQESWIKGPVGRGEAARPTLPAWRLRWLRSQSSMHHVGAAFWGLLFA